MKRYEEKVKKEYEKGTDISKEVLKIGKKEDDERTAQEGKERGTEKDCLLVSRESGREERYEKKTLEKEEERKAICR